MSPVPPTDEGRVDRLRAIAEGVVRRLGGLPAVRTLLAVLTVYDRAGGGLTAAGLAYTSLMAARLRWQVVMSRQWAFCNISLRWPSISTCIIIKFNH